MCSLTICVCVNANCANNYGNGHTEIFFILSLQEGERMRVRVSFVILMRRCRSFHMMLISGSTFFLACPLLSFYSYPCLGPFVLILLEPKLGWLSHSHLVMWSAFPSLRCWSWLNHSFSVYCFSLHFNVIIVVASLCVWEFFLLIFPISFCSVFRCASFEK